MLYVRASVGDSIMVCTDDRDAGRIRPDGISATVYSLCRYHIRGDGYVISDRRISDELCVGGRQLWYRIDDGR